jgi:hypothetical protein
VPAIATTAPVNPDLAWAIQDVKDRAPAYKRRRDYLEGRHLPVIPPVQTLSPLVASLLADLSDNMVEDVVEETVGRLEVVAWLAPGDADPDLDDDPDAPASPSATPRAQMAQDAWDRNRGAVRSTITHRDMLGMGDGFVIVEDDGTGNPDTIRWHPQLPECMAVRYSSLLPDTIALAARVWREGRRYRVNLYYPPTDPGGARLERYASRGTGADGGIPEARAFVPLAQVDPDAIPEDDTGARDWERVPVFHFPCDAVGGYGRSVITTVIPLQDLLNKAIADLVVNMEDTALPQRYGIGVQREVDPATGEDRSIKRRSRNPSDMLAIGSKEAVLGQFPAADMRPFMDVIQGWRVEIARKGYLPPYSVGSVTGDVSGLNLLVQEGRQIKRCKAVGHRDAGWVWREVMAYMLTRGGAPTEPADLDIEWAPVETRDQQAFWELAAMKRELGVPKRVLLVEGGYDPDEVDEWLEQADAMTGGRLSVPGPGIGQVGQAAALGLPGAPNGPGGAPAPALAG